MFLDSLLLCLLAHVVAIVVEQGVLIHVLNDLDTDGFRVASVRRFNHTSVNETAFRVVRLNLVRNVVLRAKLLVTYRLKE